LQKNYAEDVQWSRSCIAATLESHHV